MEIITFCYILALIFITYIDCIMKKVILALVASAFVSFAYAQDVNFDSFKRIESDKVLNLSADQIAKIKKLNKEVGPKFRAIGRSNLPGRGRWLLNTKLPLGLSCQKIKSKHGKRIMEV